MGKFASFPALDRCSRRLRVYNDEQALVRQPLHTLPKKQPSPQEPDATHRPDAAAVAMGRDDVRYVGRSVLRVEDRPLLTGTAEFIDDLSRRGEVHARMVRANEAHGTIESIDTAEALALPGVLAVLTAADVPDVRIPIRMLESNEALNVTQPPLARGVVRYVGEPVAIVVAESPYIAEDAAESVIVTLAELPAVVNIAGATSDNGPLVHGAVSSSNVVNTLRASHGPDIDEVLESAPVVITRTVGVQRHAGIPMETRGLLAEHDPDTGRVTVWGATKVKHFNRRVLARLLDIPEEDIRLVETEVGGGFGSRGEFYPEDYLIPWLAMRIGRPVKWVEDRREHFLAINHSREVECEIQVAATEDGELLALRARGCVNQGAYARTHGGVLLPWIVVRHLPGPYNWRAFDIEVKSVLSNKTPSGTYRAPGQYEAAFFRERMIDEVASHLKLDPRDVRMRNLVPVAEMPKTFALGNVSTAVDLDEFKPVLYYDCGDFPRVLDSLLTHAGYDDLRADAESRRGQGELVGVGMSAYVEEGTIGPFEYARLAAVEDRIEAYVGVAALGQGVRTALTQIAADSLQLSMEQVSLSHHDTDLIPEGIGTFGSRTAVVGGSAVLGAGKRLVAESIKAAAVDLECSPDDLELRPGGVIGVKGDAVSVVSLFDLGCEAEFKYEKAAPGFDMGATLATVHIDRETGQIDVTRVVVCHPIGLMVNPSLVEGQLAGGSAQGIGGALLEELAYDDRGQPLATSFMDYLMPTAAEIPRIESLSIPSIHHDPTTNNPLNAKGCGESGIVGVGGAVANAIADALGEHHSEVSRLPVTPSAIYDILNADSSSLWR